MVAFPTWLKTALPIAGLGVLPLAGTVYVAVAPSPTAAGSARSSAPTSVTAPIRPGEVPDSPFVSHATEAPPPRPTSLAALAANRAAFAPPETAVARDAA